MHVNPSLSERLEDAMSFYRDFHWGDEPDEVVKRKVSRAPRVAVGIGKLHSVAYSTRKGGEDATWEHEFGEDGGEQPDLVMDAATKKLHIVGGSYDVQPEGIID